ncbi:hypothetical protein [Natronosalvus caseinilyticus]|uniref:hypothetical protein n=1 Tax=Natronosalvus caseinilyticus TaxID=2953747 RepID=UPI0028AD8C01|nr:hypothetical protein [Natronosalvus caseinilyticus]
MQGTASRAGLVILLVVLLAGCSAFGSGVEEIDREPYGVDEPVDPEPSESDELLPGLTSEGVTSPHDVGTAHADILVERSFTLEQTVTWYHPNGSIVRRSSSNATAEAGGPMVGHEYVEPLHDDFVIRQDVWRANETYVRSHRPDGSVRYDRFDAFPSRFLGAGTIRQGLGSMENVTVSRATIEDDTYYVLESTDPDTRVHDTENASMRMIVHEDGYVRAFRLEHEVEHEETLTVVNDLSTNRVGDPDLNVTAPEWVEDARAATRDVVEEEPSSENETET